MPRRLALLLLLPALACATPTHQPEPEGVFVGLPWAVVQGPLRVEARFHIDQARIFGGDLGEDYGLLPVALRLGRVGGGQADLVAVPDEMHFALHLADGTTLGRVRPETANVRRRRLERLLAEGFDGGVLPPWEQAVEGFVYFALPRDMRLDSGALRVVRHTGAGTRSLSLSESLLTFEMILDGRPQTVAVGVGIDRRLGSRE